MSGGDARPARGARIGAAKEVLAKRLADLPLPARERALQRHYDSYWLAFDAVTHDRHARLMNAADQKGELLALTADSSAFRAVTELVVYTPDHPGLFSQLAGAIAVSGGSIVDAKAFTTADGFALDIFSVQDTEGGPFGDPERVERLRRTIAQTLAGQLSPRAIIAKRQTKKRASAFYIRPQVDFDNEASSASSLIEVTGTDRPGLLHHVARAIFDSGLSISSAIVATYGERAVDVFYVRDGYGHKIVHPDRQESIQGRIIKAMEAETP